MVCKITARVTVPRLSGQIQGPPKLQGSVALGAPIVDGWYSDGVRQTRQFQQVLEELRLQHQPEHWASWALDGSLEEDAGRFPIVHQSPRLEWVPVGNRLGLSGALEHNEIGLQHGTSSDFNYVHNEREFTVGLWVNSKTLPVDMILLGTNISNPITQAGFSFLKIRTSGQIRIRLYGDSIYQPAMNTGVFDHPEFIVARCFPAPANSISLFSAAQPIATGQPPPPGEYGDSFEPMSFLRGANGMDPPVIFNAFCTSQVLTDAEIYRLYVAGMADLMG